jgi:hypothetical protein
VNTINIIAEYLELMNNDIEIIYKPSEKDRDFRVYEYIIKDRFNAIKDADQVITIYHDGNSGVDREFLYEIGFAKYIGTPITHFNKKQVRLMSYLYSVATGEVK